MEFRSIMFICRSTDSQLKLWNIKKPTNLQTFKGHINEKNFVGLATDGDYVACGKSCTFLCPCYNSDISTAPLPSFRCGVID